MFALLVDAAAGFGAPITLARFAAIEGLRLIPLVVVGPVTVELRLTPEDASLSLSPMML